jgi:hypothetical protein
VPVVSYGLLGMLNWLYKWYDPRGRLGMREVAEQLSTLALSGLGAVSARPWPAAPAGPGRDGRRSARRRAAPPAR